MATTIGELSVTLRARTAKFVADMRKVSQNVKTTTKRIGNLPKALNRAATEMDTLAGSMGRLSVASAAVSAGIIAAGSKAVVAASDFEETSNVIQQSFGKNLQGEVEEWASVTARAMGRSTQQMRLFAGNMGALVQPMVGSRKEAQRMATGLSGLAVDLGSFFNVADDDALLALRAGLTGESEPLKRFGILMSEAALQTFGASQGITKLTKDMTNAEKTTLRYSFIMNATKAAQGDAVRTADGFANSLKALQGALADAAVGLGKELLPQATKLVQWAREQVQGFNELSPATKRTTATLFALGGATAAATAAGSGFLAVLPSLLKGISAVLGVNKALVASLGVGLLPVLGVVAAGVAGFVGTLKLLEAATGANLSVTSILADTYVFATESAGTFTATLRNLAGALTSVLVQVFTLGAVDLSGVFEDWSGGASDAAFAMEHLSKETQDAIAATDKFPSRVEKLQAALRKLGAEESKGNPLAMAGEFGVGEDVFQFKAGGGEGLKNASKIVELNKQLRGLFEERQRALDAVSSKRRKDEDARKKAASDAAAEADKERTAAEAKAKAEAAAQRRAAAAQAKAKQLEALRKKAPETIAKIELDAERELSFQAAGVAEPALRAVLGAEDKINQLSEAFNALGADLDDPRFLAAADLIDQAAMGQVKAFLESKKETEGFGDLVRKVADTLQGAAGLNVTAEDLGVDPALLGDQDAAREAAQRAVEALRGSAMAGATEFGTGLGDTARRLAQSFGVKGMEAIEKGDVDGIVSAAVTSVFQEAAKRAQAAGLEAPDLSPELLGLVGDLGGVAGGAVSGDGTGTVVGGALGAAISAAGGPIGMAAGAAIGGVIESAAGAITDTFMAAFDFVADGITGAAAVVAGVISGAGQTIGDAIPEGRLSSAVQSGFGTVAAVITTAAAVTAAAITAAGAAFLLLTGPVMGLTSLFASIAVMLAAAFMPMIPLAIVIGVVLIPVVIALAVGLAALAVIVALLAAGLLATVGLVVAFASLAAETESFKNLMLGFEASVDKLVQRLEPLGEAMVPLLGAFDVFLDVILVFIDAFLGVTDMGPLIFDAFKLVLLGVSGFLFVVAVLQNIFLELVAVIAEAGISLVGAFHQIGQGMAAGLKNFLEALQPVLALFGIMPGELTDAIGDLSGLMGDTAGAATGGLRDVADGARGMAPDLGMLGLAIRNLANLSMEDARIIGDNLIKKKKIEDAVNESLLNVPQGFKVSLARFRAIQTGADVGGRSVDIDTGGAGSPGAPQFFIESVVLQGLDDATLEALSDKMQRAAERQAQDQGGNPSASGNLFSRGGI